METLLGAIRKVPHKGARQRIVRPIPTMRVNTYGNRSNFRYHFTIPHRYHPNPQVEVDLLIRAARRRIRNIQAESKSKLAGYGATGTEPISIMVFVNGMEVRF